jgi:integrase/recombinase XerD
MSANVEHEVERALGVVTTLAATIGLRTMRRYTVSVFDSVSTTAAVLRADEPRLDEAELAAVAFLARYGGRTRESYRADLRQYLAWIAAAGVPPLQATRAHPELYRAWMEERGLAAATVDRRLSTVCGYYRFAHLDGRIAANPAQHVRRPQAHPANQRGLDRGELAAFLYSAERVSPTHAALAVL